MSAAEGFGKGRLFEILDSLEAASRDTMVAARKRLAEVCGCMCIVCAHQCIHDMLVNTQALDRHASACSTHEEVVVCRHVAATQAKGAASLEPWNMGYALAGTTEKEMDPYFPFANAVDVR